MTDHTAAFFQPDHTYAREHHGETVRFLVRHVSAAPDGSYRVAFGWRVDDDGDWEPSDADDMDGWTDVTPVSSAVTAPATNQNRQFLTTLADLGIATHRLDRIRDAARLHRQQLIGTSELYAVIEADDVPHAADQAERRDRYATVIHNAMEPDLSLVDQEPGAQALFARAAEAAAALADAEQAELRAEVTRQTDLRDYWYQEAMSATARIIELERKVSSPPAAAPAVDRAAPADWIDGHPQLEAIAAAVYEQCNTDGHSGVVDDPRNIAVAALTAVLPDTSRGAVLREAEEALSAQAKHLTGEFNDSDVLHEDGPAATVATWKRAADLLRRMADEEQQPEGHSCGNCDGIDPDTCLFNPNRPPEQCPRSEGDGYGLQCQKPAGHNLCTFEEQR